MLYPFFSAREAAPFLLYTFFFNKKLEIDEMKKFFLGSSTHGLNPSPVKTAVPMCSHHRKKGRGGKRNKSIYSVQKFCGRNWQSFVSLTKFWSQKSQHIQAQEFKKDFNVKFQPTIKIANVTAHSKKNSAMWQLSQKKIRRCDIFAFFRQSVYSAIWQLLFSAMWPAPLVSSASLRSWTIQCIFYYKT